MIAAMCRLASLTLLIVTLAAGSAGVAGQPADRLGDARRLYNRQLFEMAIKAAIEAREAGDRPNEAALVIARSQLERFRQTRDAENLAAAREALRGIDANELTDAMRTEFALAMGQWLFLDDQFPVAAEFFEGVINKVEPLGLEARERVLDWWATAIDRQAQVDPSNRWSLHRRILERMEEELRIHPASTAASYWVPAAARSLGDVERAWHTAIAGYLRSRMAADGGAALRADLDQLVTTAIIPERARVLAGTGDPKAAAEVMTAEWEQLKTLWGDRTRHRLIPGHPTTSAPSSPA
jgi:hypothetical protein